ncbi:hypothetical protein ACFW04_009681 [Cataglyphis niger]
MQLLSHFHLLKSYCTLYLSISSIADWGKL